MSMTGEEVGYQDAIRQVVRAMHRRLKSIQSDMEGADPEESLKLKAKAEEVKHLINVIESLHR